MKKKAEWGLSFKPPMCCDLTVDATTACGLWDSSSDQLSAQSQVKQTTVLFLRSSELQVAGQRGYLEHWIGGCCIPSMSLPISSSVGISPQYLAGVVYHQVEDWLAVRGCGPTAIATTDRPATDECHSRAPLLPPLACLSPSLFPLSFSCLFREMPQLGVGLVWQMKVTFFGK